MHHRAPDEARSGPGFRRIASLVCLSAGVGLFVPTPPLPAYAHVQEAAQDSPASSDPQALEDQARTLVTAGRHDDALALLEQVDNGYRRAEDRSGLARVELLRSDVLRSRGDGDRALVHAEQARDLAAATRDDEVRIEALTRLARMAEDRGDPAGAARYLEEALPLAEAVTDVLTQARVLYALGRNAIARVDSHAAIEYITRAMALADQTGDLELRQMTRGSRSTAHLGLGRFDEALADAQAAYEIASASADPRVRAGAAFSLGQANSLVGMADRAAALYTEAIALYQEAGYVYGEAVTTALLVEAWSFLEDLNRTIAEGERAIALAEQAGTPWLATGTLARLALVEARQGRQDEAARYAARAREALAITPAARHLFIEADLGLAALDMGDPALARRHFARVRELAEARGEAEFEWRAQWGLGRAAAAEGRPADAEAYLEEATVRVERLRQRFPDAGLRAMFMTRRVGPWETLVQALMAQSDGPDDVFARRALEVAEAARGRALADLLAESRARLTDTRLDAVRDQEAAFGQRFSDLQARLVRTSGSEREAIGAELDELEREFEALVFRIRRENPAYAALAYPAPLTQAEMAGMLEADEALVQFLVPAGETAAFAWIVRSDRMLAYPISAGGLDGQIRLLQALLQSGDDAAIRALGSSLYETLLGPASSLLNGVHRLIIVADGPLQRLPFSVLRRGDRWLIEDHVLAMAPSATVLEHLRQLPARHTPEPLLAFAAAAGTAERRAGSLFEAESLAVAGLPEAADEVRDIARVTGAGRDALRVGPAATEAGVKASGVESYRILHFATHAVVDEIVPRRSAILLAGTDNEDGLLQLNEIANLTLNADLVVLAACRSQMGRSLRGEGLLSLSRAFMHAGARAVTASLWDVGDSETRVLMRSFYTGLRAGLAPDEALRRTQLEMLQSDGRLASPSSWAAFVIAGDASRPLFDARPPAMTRWPWALAGGGAFALAFVVTVWRWRRR